MFFTAKNKNGANNIMDNKHLQYALFPAKHNAFSTGSHISTPRPTTTQKLITKEALTNVEPTQPQPQEKQEKKLMKWGEPCWFLFHTLAHKVKNEDFSSIRTEFLQLFYDVCSALPCPECSTHAIAHLDKSNFMRIQTKEQLIEFLFQFHNYVNGRKRFPLFEREELEEKYSKAITMNIIYYFTKAFQDKSHNSKLIADELHRTRMTHKVNEWLKHNIQHFDA